MGKLSVEYYFNRLGISLAHVKQWCSKFIIGFCLLGIAILLLSFTNLFISPQQTVELGEREILIQQTMQRIFDRRLRNARRMKKEGCPYVPKVSVIRQEAISEIDKHLAINHNEGWKF